MRMRVKAQASQHEDAVIEADAEAIRALAAALQRARNERHAQCGPFDSDGRNLEIKIVVDDSRIFSHRWRRAKLPYTDPEAASWRTGPDSLAPEEHARMVLASEGTSAHVTACNLLDLLHTVTWQIFYYGPILNLHEPSRDDGTAWIVTNGPGCQDLVRALERVLESGSFKLSLIASDDEGFDLRVRCLDSP